MPLNCSEMLNAFVLVQMFSSPLLHQLDTLQLKEKKKRKKMNSWFYKATAFVFQHNI